MDKGRQPDTKDRAEDKSDWFKSNKICNNTNSFHGCCGC
nr:MAG TPA: hypothetical protein [Caudoviricetes sp.]